MPNCENSANAPRLRAYINRKLFDNGALFMERVSWESIKQNLDLVFDIDITPMSKILSKTYVLGCIVQRIDQDVYKIKLYRIDTHDDPIYNVDTYILHERFSERPDFPLLIKYASTSFDKNMVSFHDRYVILEKAIPEDDHHSTYEELPASIKKRVKDI